MKVVNFMEQESSDEKKTIEEGYAEFVKNRTVRNLSSETLTYYDDCIDKFSIFHSRDKNCDTINLTLYQDYIISLQSQKEPKLKDVSINKYLRGIKTVFNFFIKLGYVKPFQMYLLEEDEIIKECYSDAELEILLKKPNLKKDKRFPNYRTWVMENILLAVGPRISTVINIKVEDILFDEKKVYLRKMKRRKAIYVPLDDDMADILQEYITRLGLNPEDYLFCTQFGGQHQLSRKRAHESIQEYNQERGVMKTSPHLFRHTFAKLSLKNGADIFTLQDIMGITSVEVLRRYARLYGQDIQDKYNEFNPHKKYTSQNKKKMRI